MKKVLLCSSHFGLLSGFMGWFMVESGLVNKPDVSHFRLSAHLVTAFVIYALLLNAFWNNLNKKIIINVLLKMFPNVMEKIYFI